MRSRRAKMLLSYTPLHWMSKNDLLPRGWPLRLAASAPKPMQDEINRSVSDHVRTDTSKGQDDPVDDVLDEDDDVDVDDSSVEHEEWYAADGYIATSSLDDD